MSVRVMTRVWDAEFPTLPMKLIALKLADCANDEGENIYPSVGRVERETGASPSVVREALADMEAVGLLRVIADNFGNRRGRSTTVRAFDLDRLRALSDGWLVWQQREVPVRDLKTGEQKIGQDGSPKTRKAWRLAQATPPAGGGVALRLADPTPPAGGGVPLRLADPTPPAGGGAIEEPSLEPSKGTVTVPPPSPPAAAGKGGRGWLDELRGEGHPPVVVDDLLARLVQAGLATWKDADPIGPGRQVCLDLAADTVGVVEAIREAILDQYKFRLPPVASFREIAANCRLAASAPSAVAASRASAPEVVVLEAESRRFLEAVRRPDVAGPAMAAAWFAEAGVVAVEGRSVTVVTPCRPALIEQHAGSVANAAARLLWGAAASVTFVQGRAAPAPGRTA